MSHYERLAAQEAIDAENEQCRRTWELRYEHAGEYSAWTVREVRDDGSLGHPVWADDTGIDADHHGPATLAAGLGLSEYVGIDPLRWERYSDEAEWGGVFRSVEAR